MIFAFAGGQRLDSNMKDSHEHPTRRLRVPELAIPLVPFVVLLITMTAALLVDGDGAPEYTPPASTGLVAPVDDGTVATAGAREELGEGAARDIDVRRWERWPASQGSPSSDPGFVDADAGIGDESSVREEPVDESQVRDGEPAGRAGDPVELGERALEPYEAATSDDAVMAEEEQTRSPTEMALRWLQDHQELDGSWSADDFMATGRERGREAGRYGVEDGRLEESVLPLPPIGLTGLALLAYMSAGYTHKDNEFADTIKMALRYLKNQQDDDGCFVPQANPGAVYAHAICAAALCDAYALTGSSLLKGPTQRGVDFLTAAQREDDELGWLGWGASVEGDRLNTAVTGWALVALASAKSAAFVVPSDCFDGARRSLDHALGDTCACEGTASPAGAVEALPLLPADLRDPNTQSTLPAIEATRIFARLLAVDSSEDPCLVRQARWIASRGNLPALSDPFTLDATHWFFATRALMRVHGESWRTWREAICDAILDSQHRDGDRAYALCGSWDPAGEQARANGRVYATAINVITLQTGSGCAHCFCGGCHEHFGSD